MKTWREPITDRLARLSRGKRDPSACWEWLGPRDHLGYGKIQIARRSRLAHRVSYEVLVGPIPDGLEIDHLCRNRGCVNPTHLEVVTHQENMRRATALITQCPSGHPYDDTNTRIYDGRRYCIACGNARSAIRSRRSRAARKVADA